MSEIKPITYVGCIFTFNKQQNYWQSCCCHAIGKQNTIVWFKNTS